MTSDLGHLSLELRKLLYRLLEAVGKAGVSSSTYDSCVRAFENYPIVLPDKHRFWFEDRARKLRPAKSATDEGLEDALRKMMKDHEKGAERDKAIVDKLENILVLDALMEEMRKLIPQARDSEEKLAKKPDEEAGGD